MKRLVVVLIALSLVAAACGDDDAAGQDPASITSCEGLADAGVALLQDTIDLIDGLDVAALAALGEGTDVPPEFTAIQDRGDQLSARAVEVGCSDEQMTGLLVDRIGDLKADSLFGQFILEGVRSGDGGFFSE